MFGIRFGGNPLGFNRASAYCQARLDPITRHFSVLSIHRKEITEQPSKENGDTPRTEHFPRSSTKLSPAGQANEGQSSKTKSERRRDYRRKRYHEDAALRDRALSQNKRHLENRTERDPLFHQSSLLRRWVLYRPRLEQGCLWKTHTPEIHPDRIPRPCVGCGHKRQHGLRLVWRRNSDGKPFCNSCFSKDWSNALPLGCENHVFGLKRQMPNPPKVSLKDITPKAWSRDQRGPNIGQ